MNSLKIGFFLLLAAPLLVSAQDCKYDKNGVQTPPYVWMSNKLEGRTVRRLKGTVTDNKEYPIPGAMVSVSVLTANGSTFIGAYETDSEGRFCFGGLKKGRYYLKVGHRSFQLYELEVTLDPKSKTAPKSLEFALDFGY